MWAVRTRVRGGAEAVPQPRFVRFIWRERAAKQPLHLNSSLCDNARAQARRPCAAGETCFSSRRAGRQAGGHAHGGSSAGEERGAQRTAWAWLQRVVWGEADQQWLMAEGRSTTDFRGGPDWVVASSFDPSYGVRYTIQSPTALVLKSIQ